MKKYIGLLLFFALSMSMASQEKEVLIMGTMHSVPAIVKNSYKPLLRYAMKYKPEAVYVEFICPDDTVSLQFFTPRFLHISDSIRAVKSMDESRFAELRSLPLAELTEEDFGFLSEAYLIKRDRANHLYYNYLRKYGVRGADKAFGNENEDLSFKLATAMNIRELYCMDDQQTTDKYYKAWSQARKAGEKNGDNREGDRLIKRDYNRSILPALLGRLGKYTNSPASLYRKHLVNSFRYVKSSTPYSEEAAKYWDERNSRMAKNIASQVRDNSHLRSIVIVGAGHVVGLKEALEKCYPELKVRLMYH